MDYFEEEVSFVKNESQRRKTEVWSTSIRPKSEMVRLLFLLELSGPVHVPLESYHLGMPRMVLDR